MHGRGVRAENCSCVFCIRALHGAICRGRMDAQERRADVTVKSYNLRYVPFPDTQS